MPKHRHAAWSFLKRTPGRRALVGVAAVAVVAGGGGTTAWALTGGNGPQVNSAIADAQAHKQRQEQPRANRDQQRKPLSSASPKAKPMDAKHDTGTKSATTMLRAEKAKPESSAPSSSGTSHGGGTQGGTTCQASNYGQGTTTASGEPFDAGAMTAAHKTLPFGTKLRVTNVSNGRSVVVRVNDRGPFVAGRCLDLTTGAFSRIASMGAGVATVRYVVLSKG